MKIGVPKEIKDQEYRVAVVPAGVKALVSHGHEVFVETSAGAGIGVEDSEYKAVGAKVLPTAAAVWESGDVIAKVKEPMPTEWPHIRQGQVLFTYFHFASSQPLAKAMMERGAVCIAYETVEDRKGTHPLLTPMSEIAGRLSIQQGAKYLEKIHGGRGTLLGGVPGVKPAQVAIVGGGVVGTNAAKMAAGLGARVTILDLNLDRLRYLDDVMPANVNTLYASEFNVQQQLQISDVVVGGVYLTGAKAPHVVTREDLKLMHKGAVMVDVAIDQGGCFESSRPTSHSNPVYELDGIIHYCVTNMPGAVARTSTFALTNATLPYLLRLADDGYPGALRNDPLFLKGLNIADGRIFHSGVGDTFHMPTHDSMDLVAKL
ncbi:alanine dehydrogenase [Candidatus Poribacteria bacterium]|nr:alanine dehydrogenase [Candidatus Poribacteria bacterium]